ncbi:MAG TPA: DUF1622 domain-containing protein [Ktedonobacterales bacterium]|nr:DUF1622 domain-containing protein [Ktedonobacterales bacterium]
MDFSAVTGGVERGFEIVGLIVLIFGTTYSLLAFLVAVLRGKRGPLNGRNAYRALREGLGKAILLGLELLVAADIIHSVTVNPTFVSIGVLGLIVVVRTFLSWSLEVEISGEWPWRRAASRTEQERNTAV